MPTPAGTIDLIINQSSYSTRVNATLYHSVWVPRRGLNRRPITDRHGPATDVPACPATVRNELWTAYFALLALFTPGEREVLHDYAMDAYLAFLRQTPPA